ncbi:hypothetical protein HDU81_009299 [Chytriomyces hyalinus]|nr:hypothetical protein HDU81_009299 [Chytriomyces hyalinus]
MDANCAARTKPTASQKKKKANKKKRGSTTRRVGEPEAQVQSQTDIAPSAEHVASESGQSPPSFRPLSDATKNPMEPFRFQLDEQHLQSVLPPAVGEICLDALSLSQRTTTQPQPSFTTPSLDFSHFSGLIRTNLELMQQRIAELASSESANVTGPLFESQPDYLIQASKRANLERIFLVADAIAQFNILTKPPPRQFGKRRASTDSSSTTPATMSASSSCDALPLDPISSESVFPFAINVTIPSSNTEQHPFSTLKPLIDSLNSSHTTFDITLNPKSRAEYHFLRASIYSCLPWRDERVGENLGRCIKLDPNRIDAWNMMGEWYCHGNMWDLGEQCFESSLAVTRKNRDSLLNLAQVIRTRDISKLDESEKLCREAIALDPNDGKPWWALGCLLLKKFFSIPFELNTLQDALAAFENAACDTAFSSKDPDLYGNRASIYFYMQSYQKSLQDFAKSAQLDPFQSGMSALPKMAQLKATVTAVAKCLEKHQQGSISGATKKKSASKFPNPFNDKVKMDDILDVASSPVDETHNFVERDKLHAGKCITLQILETVSTGLPCSYIGKDPSGNCICVSVFNISVPIKAGDEIIVMHPCLFKISVDFENCQAEYWNLRIDRPWFMAVNGKVVEKTNVQLTQARFESS